MHQTQFSEKSRTEGFTKSGHIFMICHRSQFGQDGPGIWPYVPICLVLQYCPSLAWLHKSGCSTSMNSVYYQIAVHISRYLVGVVVHNRPKVGVVEKWAWFVKFGTHFTCVIFIFYFVPASPFINMAWQLCDIDVHQLKMQSVM